MVLVNSIRSGPRPAGACAGVAWRGTAWPGWGSGPSTSCHRRRRPTGVLLGLADATAPTNKTHAPGRKLRHPETEPCRPALQPW